MPRDGRIGEEEADARPTPGADAKNHHFDPCMGFSVASDRLAAGRYDRVRLVGVAKGS